MDPRALIVSRIDLQLRQHLHIGIDHFRALDDAVYMRDVLFVCDAMRDTKLPVLARQYRVAEAAVQRPGHDAGPPQAWAANTSGFGLSQPPVAEPSAPLRPARAWFAPRRWRSD